MDFLSDLATWLGVWGGLAALLIMLKTFEDEVKEGGEYVATAIYVFSTSVDRRFFGKALVSWRAVLTSALITLLGAALIPILIASISFYLGKQPFGLRFDGQDTTLPSGAIIWSLAAYVGLLAFIANLVFDFVSILVTRRLIEILARKDNGYLLAAGIILDAVLNVLFFVAAIISFMAFAALLLSYVGVGENIEWARLFNLAGLIDRLLVLDEISEMILWCMLGPLLSSFFTSLWLYIFALGWSISNMLLGANATLFEGKRLNTTAVGCAAVGLLGLPVVVLISIFGS